MSTIPYSLRSLPEYNVAAVGVSAKQFIEKALRVRARLIAQKKGSQHHAVVGAYNNVRNWYKFWNPNEAQCAAYVARHQDLFSLIIPSKESKCHNAFTNELNLITNGITSSSF